jgi:hypothetical protein
VLGARGNGALQGKKSKSEDATSNDTQKEAMEWAKRVGRSKQQGCIWGGSHMGNDLYGEE